MVCLVQGFTVFGDILNFFQHRNNWVGWTCFLLLYTANISLFLPGILLIMGAGFVFGCAAHAAPGHIICREALWQS